jgi:hypothetical protein
MDLEADGKKQKKTKLPSLRNGGRKPTTLPSYIRKEPKDSTTSESRSNNSSQEIRYLSLTPTFIYLVTVSFVVREEAHT